MIRVTVELLPGGNPRRAQTIGVLEVTNDVSAPDKDWGNYNVIMTDVVEGRPRHSNNARVLGHHREAPFWKLIESAISVALQNRMRGVHNPQERGRRQPEPQCRFR